MVNPIIILFEIVRLRFVNVKIPVFWFILNEGVFRTVIFYSLFVAESSKNIIII